jgi:hypothetical protein
MTLHNLCKRDPEINKRIACGQSKGRRALRAVQMKVALSGNTNLLIWLGRCILKQCPNDEMHVHTGNGASDMSELSTQAKEHLAELARHLNQAAIAVSTREIETEIIGRDGTVTNDNNSAENIIPIN